MLFANATHGVEWEQVTLTIEGEERSLRIALPDAFEGERYPVIVGFHGYRGDVKVWFYEYTHFHEFIPQRNFIAVYPEGPMSWSPAHNGRDFAFFEEIIDHLKAKYPVDDERIYVVGHSNGAGIASALVSMRPNIVAAGAVQAGLYRPRKSEHRPATSTMPPLLLTWGSEDQLQRPTQSHLQDMLEPFEAFGHHTELLIIEGMQHGWGGPKFQLEETMLDFLFQYSLADRPGSNFRPKSTFRPIAISTMWLDTAGVIAGAIGVAALFAVVLIKYWKRRTPR